MQPMKPKVFYFACVVALAVGMLLAVLRVQSRGSEPAVKLNLPVKINWRIVDSNIPFMELGMVVWGRWESDVEEHEPGTVKPASNPPTITAKPFKLPATVQPWNRETGMSFNFVSPWSDAEIEVWVCKPLAWTSEKFHKDNSYLPDGFGWVSLGDVREWRTHFEYPSGRTRRFIFAAERKDTGEWRTADLSHVLAGSHRVVRFNGVDPSGRRQ